MARLKVFTWNMQRGNSISSIGQPGNSLDKNKASVRLSLLQDLCNKYDVGFVTEAGPDLVNAVKNVNQTSALLPGGTGYWSAPLRDDKQGKGGCKNLLFSKYKVEGFDMNFKSGKDDACRYPAAGIASLGDMKLLLVTLHATSGGGGWQNSEELVEYLEEIAPKAKFEAVLIGGDMNSNKGYFTMPKIGTHQTGHVLDGYYADHCDKEVFPEINEISVMVDQGSHMFNAGDELGYYVRFNKELLIRVSDHAPVIASVTVKRRQTENMEI